MICLLRRSAFTAAMFIFTLGSSGSAAPMLTGAMRPFNSMLGRHWHCAARLQQAGQKSIRFSYTLANTVAPLNTFHLHLEGDGIMVDQYYGYNGRRHHWFQSSTDNLGLQLRELSIDGASYRGRIVQIPNQKYTDTFRAVSSRKFFIHEVVTENSKPPAVTENTCIRS